MSKSEFYKSLEDYKRYVSPEVSPENSEDSEKSASSRGGSPVEDESAHIESGPDASEGELVHT